jgi:hypothetical protein
MAAFTSGYSTFALAVTAANTTPPGILVVDTACTLAASETVNGSLTFAGGSISLGNFNLTITQLIGTLPAQQQFIQTGTGILTITTATPPYTLEQFGGGIYENGTGVYDNANAFYLAFNWMNSSANAPGGVLYLGPGTYQTSTRTTAVGSIPANRQLTYNSTSGALDISNITVQGSGKEATTIKVVSANSTAYSGWLTDDLFPVGNTTHTNSTRYTHDVVFQDLTVDDSLRVLPVWLSNPMTGAPVPNPWNDYWAFGGNVLNPNYWAYLNGVCQSQPLLCPGATGLLLNGLNGPPSGGALNLTTSLSKFTVTSSQNSPAVNYQITGTLVGGGSNTETFAANPTTQISAHDYTAITSVIPTSPTGSPTAPAGGGATNTIHGSQAVIAGNLLLNNTPFALGNPAQQVTFYTTSSSGLTGVGFTIYGTNVFGLPQTETVTGPATNAIAASANFYASVWQIVASATVAGAHVIIGATAWSVTVNTGGYSLNSGGSNPTSICLSQSMVASTALTLNGALAASASLANLANQGQQVVFTSAFDLSGVTFAIVGKDAFGNSVTETVTGQSLTYGYGISTFTSVYSYGSITSITPSSTGPAGSTVSVGTTQWGIGAGFGSSALNAICEYQSPAISTTLAINGTLSGNNPPTANQVTVPAAIPTQNVTISSPGNLSGYTFSIAGSPTGETGLAGPNNGTVLSKNKYSTITGITISGTTTIPLQAGLTTPGYQVGDVLTVYGGTVAGGGSPMQLIVTAVQNGAVLSASISQEGSYTAFPALPFATTGGHGIGASFSIAPTVQVGASNIDNVCLTQPVSGSGTLSLSGTLGGSIGAPRQLLFTSSVPLTGATITIGGTGTTGYSNTGASVTGEGPTSWPSGATTFYSSNMYTALAATGAITYSSAPSAQIQVGTDNFSIFSVLGQARRNVNLTVTGSYGSVFHFTKTDRYRLENVYFKNHQAITVTDSGCRGGRIVDCVFDTCGKDDDAFQCIWAQSYGAPAAPTATFSDTEDIQVIRPVARNCNRMLAIFDPTRGGKIIDADAQNMKEGGILVDQYACYNGGRIEIIRPKIYNVVIGDIEGTGIIVSPGGAHVDIVDSDIENTHGRWMHTFGASDVDIHGGRALNNAVNSAALLGGIVDGTTITAAGGGTITISQPTTVPIPMGTTLEFYSTMSVTTSTTLATANFVVIPVIATSSVTVGMMSIGNFALSNGAMISAINPGISITVSAQTSLSISSGTTLFFYNSSGTPLVTGSAATPVGSTTISIASGSPVVGMASVGNALIPGSLINITYPYGPFSERYLVNQYSTPLAGSPLAGTPVLTAGISTTPMQNVRIRDVDFENNLNNGTTITLIEPLKSGTPSGLCEDFFFEGNNIRNLPYDTLFWNSSVTGIWDPEMSVFVKDNRGHPSQAPVIVQDNYAAYDSNPRQYNLGFRPSEIEVTMQQTGSGGPISSSNAYQIWNGSSNGQSASVSFFTGLTEQLATVTTNSLTLVSATTIVLSTVGLPGAGALQQGMISLGNSAVGLPDGVSITNVNPSTNTITLSGHPAWQIAASTNLTFYAPLNLGFYGNNALTGTTGSSTTNPDSSVITLTAGTIGNVSVGQMSGGNSNLGLPDGSTITAVSTALNTINVSLPTTASIAAGTSLSFFNAPPLSVNNPAVVSVTSSGSTAAGATAIVLGSLTGLKVRMTSIGNAGIGLPDGAVITAINTSTSTITVNMPTTVTIATGTPLNFYNPGQTQTQSVQSSPGQIANSAGTIVNSLSIGYWEQGVIVTPTANVQAATYQFLFRP